MSYFMMFLLLGIYAMIILARAEYQPDKADFFDLYDSTMLKGVFCIIVVLVHVPAAYQNRIQDMVGSFAYIGVTFFFMTSSYGLKYGIDHKENYLHGFWLKRLPALLVPALLCNIMTASVSAIMGNKISVLSVIGVSGWVRVLLVLYLVFWVIYYISDKLKIRKCRRDMIICLVIISFSLVDRLTPLKLTLIWPTESIGFAYGIILADCKEWLKKWSDRSWMKKSILLFGIGLITGLAYLKFKPVEFLGDYLLKIFLGFILLMLLLHLMRRIKIGNKVLAFLGSISYEVYLLHGAVFSFVAEIAGIENSGIFIWVAVIVTVAVAVILKKISDPLVAVFINRTLWSI